MPLFQFSFLGFLNQINCGIASGCQVVGKVGLCHSNPHLLLFINILSWLLVPLFLAHAHMSYSTRRPYLQFLYAMPQFLCQGF